MKYKDRKDAKRKYKQVILTTVTTMTLGVSTLGPTASAFAAEGDNSSVISSLETQVKNTELAENNLINNVKKQINDLGPAVKFVGTTTSELIKYANEGPEQLNDTLRAITIAGTGLIPGGGMLVAPMISSIWPETNGINSQLNKLRTDLTKLTNKIDNEINNEQLNSLSIKFKTLRDSLTNLEKVVNADNAQNADNSQKNYEDTKTQRGILANNIQYSFRSLLDYTSDDKHKDINLPIYTKVALAHLLFLNSVSHKAVSSKMNITEQSLKEIYMNDGFGAITNSYLLHIKKTYDDTTAPHIKKIKQVPEFHFNLGDAENQIKDLKDRLSKVKEQHRQWALDWGRGGGIVPIGGKEDTKFKSDIAILEDAISSYEFVEKFYNTTVNDPAIPAMKELAKENEKYYSLDEGTYKIVYPQANKIVDFGEHRIEHPVIWDSHDGKNQQWEFKYDADKKAYQIINKEDGRVLAYNTTPNADDTALVTENQHKPEHYWILEGTGDGNVMLVNYENKNKVLDVYDTRTESGARLYVRDKINNSAAQKFKLVKIG
ncbi:RICIN domain-containing protein [Bacillus thuringiensis]|uniref:RICIN domain-containing protein n=1 Tax=Bacillus thuringiensis TaxID=1428 RepID=UPI003D137678|nr:insecticidal toxin protein [Bacillus thuringiensis]